MRQVIKIMVVKTALSIHSSSGMITVPLKVFFFKFHPELVETMTELTEQLSNTYLNGGGY